MAHLRGALYALTFTALVLLEHSIYHNLLGPEYAPLQLKLVEADYQQLLLLIIVLRTTPLATVALDVDLRPYAGQSVTLILVTAPGMTDNSAGDRAGWGLPWLMRGTVDRRFGK